MKVEFRSEVGFSRFLDPREDFTPAERRCETRIHPLTGHTTRVAHIGMPPRQDYRAPDDLREAAPPIFAPPHVTEITPRYRPEDLPQGRYTRGRCVLFPNLNPYDVYSPVIAIGDVPFVEPHAIDPDDLADALALAREFFRDLPDDVHTGVVGWNFWPAGGSSIPHPHLQAVASGRIPDRQRRERDGEQRFAAAGTDFWSAYLETERDGERWLGAADGWSAVIDFAPRTVVPETVLVADGPAHLQGASDEALAALARWLVRLIRAHVAQGIASFDVVLHPTAPMGEPGTRLRARYLPRVYIVEPTHSADMVWVQMGLEEGLTSIVPEEWATTIRDALG